MANVTGGPALEELAPSVPELIARWYGWEPTEGRRTQSAEELPQGQRLLRYAEEGAELFQNPDGVAYATVEVAGHRETHPIKSTRFKDWLLMCFYRDHGKAPNTGVTTDTRNTIRAKALFDGPEIEVYIRVAEHEGDIYIDLGNERWEVVKVTRE